ncbi:MAG TPA: hypothetical protein VNI52_02775 [Sphingobacteriaceae bacterium]|nr:hypothetical protein [Sphingobacteriaceae bacterium]
MAKGLNSNISVAIISKGGTLGFLISTGAFIHDDGLRLLFSFSNLNTYGDYY